MIPSAIRFYIPPDALVIMGRFEEYPAVGISSPNIIDELSAQIFAERWKELVGELPAAMFENRRQMLMLLVESLPVESLTPTGNLLSSSRFATM
jgi:hypothetical protein